MSKRSATAAALEEEQVVVAKLPGRFAKNANGEPMKWPVKEGYSRVNVCSSSPGASKQLSPMLVGPVDIEKYIGIKLNEDEGFKRYGIELPRQATNVENLWQFSKLWEGEENADGSPKKEWYERRRAGFMQQKGQRHVKKGKGPNKNVALYSVWGKNKFHYVKARARIYCPIYSELVKKTPFFLELQARIADGEKIMLLDYDGYDKGSKTLYECFDDETKPFGHGFVLASLLLKLDPLPWDRPVYTADDSIGEK